MDSNPPDPPKPTIIPQQPQVSRPPTPNQIRPGGEYLVIIQNPRNPGGVTQAIRYGGPVPSNIFQGNPGIMQARFIRATASSASGIQAPTSQVQTTTMASRPITIGPRQLAVTSTGQQPILPAPMRHQILPRGPVPNLIARGMGVHPSMMPTGQPISMGATSMGSPVIYQTTNTIAANTLTANTNATAPSQMTPDDAVAKGINFFKTLLNKVQEHKKATITNLIQSLTDAKISPAEFATRLQRELESGPQHQLVPFLELLLPRLRQSIASGATQLPGIRAPPMLEPSKPVTPSTSSPNKAQPAKKKKVPLPPGQKSAWAMKKEAREAKKKEREELAQAGLKIEKPVKPKQEKQKKQEKQLESLSSALRDDDDVNDVATMGGVNLAEETQKIMASGAELVGTQIRSCKDEHFLDTQALGNRIAGITKKYNLSEPSKDVITMVSHATQEHLKNIVERLGILAEHRSENLKFDPKYEISYDIKGQMKFLAELDRIEKRRYEEQERELLLRVAKSRSKVEDPEQQKLRQKAKDMQRAEQEEVRQREANETALLAIGPRKKIKSSIGSSISSLSQSSEMKDQKSTDSRGDSVRRVKRVNMRDLQVLLELDRTHLDRLVKITAQ